jgi:hypothetical protein
MAIYLSGDPPKKTKVSKKSDDNFSTGRAHDLSRSAESAGKWVYGSVRFHRTPSGRLYEQSAITGDFRPVDTLPTGFLESDVVQQGDWLDKEFPGPTEQIVSPTETEREQAYARMYPEVSVRDGRYEIAQNEPEIPPATGEIDITEAGQLLNPGEVIRIPYKGRTLVLKRDSQTGELSSVFADAAPPKSINRR